MRRHLAPILAGCGILVLMVVAGLSFFGPGQPAMLASAETWNPASSAPVAPVSAPVIRTPATLPNDGVSPLNRSGAALPAVTAAPSPPGEQSASVPRTSALSTKVSLPVRLRIDSIRLDTKVVPTALVSGVWQVADFAAGYMEGTGLPGQTGNLAISGHDDIRGEVFRHLKSVHVGDSAIVYTADSQYRYVVDSIRYVGPYETSVIDPTPDERLTLITCWPDFATPKAAYNSLRLIVRAKLAG